MPAANVNLKFNSVQPLLSPKKQDPIKIPARSLQGSLKIPSRSPHDPVKILTNSLQNHLLPKNMWMLLLGFWCVC